MVLKIIVEIPGNGLEQDCAYYKKYMVITKMITGIMEVVVVSAKIFLKHSKIITGVTTHFRNDHACDHGRDKAYINPRVTTEVHYRRNETSDSLGISFL